MYKIFALAIFTAVLFGCTRPTAGTADTPSGNQVTSNSLAHIDSNMNSEPPPSNVGHSPTIGELRELQRKRSLTNSPITEPPPLPQFKPAQENSVVSTSMNAKGAVVETRVFKDDPQVAKVEMTWNGPKNNVMRIYLRTGKVVVAKADDIKNLGAVPVSALLEKAGVKGLN